MTRTYRGNFLFGAVKLTKKADLDKYKYSSYDVGFDLRSEFSWKDGSVGSVFIFEVDNNSSLNNDGRNKNILVLGEGRTQSIRSCA